MNSNVRAFLATVMHTEGTDKYQDPYAVTFEGKFTITDFTDHPAVLGTWLGEPLDFLGPAYKGKVSTAAGAYQLIKPTWLSCKEAMSLPDFSPASQDRAALFLLHEAGAFDYIVGGDLAAAVARCRNLWASLPSSSAGQPTIAMADIRTFFTQAGGTLA